jgi:hypothetical protein
MRPYRRANPMMRPYRREMEPSSSDRTDPLSLWYERESALRRIGIGALGDGAHTRGA